MKNQRNIRNPASQGCVVKPQPRLRHQPRSDGHLGNVIHISGTRPGEQRRRWHAHHVNRADTRFGVCPQRIQYLVFRCEWRSVLRLDSICCTNAKRSILAVNSLSTIQNPSLTNVMPRHYRRLLPTLGAFLMAAATLADASEIHLRYPTAAGIFPIKTWKDLRDAKVVK